MSKLKPFHGQDTMNHKRDLTRGQKLLTSKNFCNKASMPLESRVLQLSGMVTGIHLLETCSAKCVRQVKVLSFLVLDCKVVLLKMEQHPQ